LVAGDVGVLRSQRSVRQIVIAGLDPAIQQGRSGVDHRVKPGDDVGAWLSQAQASL